MNIFKTEKYLANSGIIYGMYGGIGYVDLNLESRISLKRSYRKFKRCFKKILNIIF